MTDQSRIDDLRRRVQKDPASIAFAQLAEECRRAGQYEEAVEVCRTGLAIHPGYLSAHVTLGRALLELSSLDEAQAELEFVLKSAAENLAAIRGLAEIHHRRGALPEALAQYRAALLLARNDPDLQRTVADLERVVEPPKPPAADEGLSFAEVESEFLKNLPPPPSPPAVVESGIQNSDSGIREEALPPSPVTPPAVEVGIKNSELGIREAEPPPPPPAVEESGVQNSEGGIRERIPDSRFQIPDSEVERERAVKTIAALEQWLDAIHVTRTQPGA
jgi:tetratricopeptide (TPR) repeat protein